MAGINYKKISGVLAGHREFSKNALSRLGSTSSPINTYIGGSPSAPYGWIKIPSAFADLFPDCGSGRIARNPGASGLDVATDYHCFRNAPDANGPSDLYNYATVNLVVTPHVAGTSPEAMQAAYQRFVDNATRHFSGQPLVSAVAL